MCSLGSNLHGRPEGACHILHYPTSHWNPAYGRAPSLVASSFAREGSPCRLLLFRAAQSRLAKARAVALPISPCRAHPLSDAKELSDADVKILQQAGKLHKFGDRILRKGLSGEDVRELQRYLQSTGHFNSPDGCTGYFGFQTQSAVQEWQSDHGVLQTGIFGRQSREAYTHLLAVEVQKLRSRRFFLAWVSTDNPSPASVSQHLHRPAIQGSLQRIFVVLLILAGTLALANQLRKTWLKHLHVEKLQLLLEQQSEADMAQLRLLNRKRWLDALDVDRA